jgi:hypothetical protein
MPNVNYGVLVAAQNLNGLVTARRKGCLPPKFQIRYNSAEKGVPTWNTTLGYATKITTGSKTG